MPQQAEGWGAKTTNRLVADLSSAFPGVTGFGVRGLKYMRALAEAYPDAEFVQQAVAQLPWGRNVRILDTVTNAEERELYIRPPLPGHRQGDGDVIKPSLCLL